MSKKTILIAAGGTGGHLFPAQTLAEQLLSQGGSLVFAGAGLQSNPYFDRSRFEYHEIDSISPFGGVKALLKAPFILVRGIVQSMRILRKEKVVCVVGFGSYHTFPLLVASYLRSVPLILFEPNAHPGKVNRLFSRVARYTAIPFETYQGDLRGNTVFVKALTRTLQRIERTAAARYFSLDAQKKTLLIFGGSQGARFLNETFLHHASALAPLASDWQVLHFVGKHDPVEPIREQYAHVGIRACVKEFEEKMDTAWSLADLVVSRAGATTIAEILHYYTPAIVIPFPAATDDHQTKNGRVLEQLQGGSIVSQKEGQGQVIRTVLATVPTLVSKKEALQAAQKKGNQPDLSRLIISMVHHGKE